MKKLALILVLSMPIGTMAQEFAPPGAIWHYTQTSWIDPELITFKTIESVSDTSINGKDCKKLIEVERYYADTVCTYTHYVYSENDSVLFFKDNAFHVLYDFGAEAGDTVVLDYYLTGDGSPLLMIIDSTGIIEINGIPFKIQYITCGDGYYIEFGGPVISGIGSTYFLFPTYDGTVNGPLRCYSDEIIGFYINYFYTYGWNFEDCDQIITDIEEPESIFSTTIYPNPSSDRIFVKNATPSSAFKISDSNGKPIKQGLIDISGEISIKELEHGLYFLQLTANNHFTVKKFIRN